MASIKYDKKQFKFKIYQYIILIQFNLFACLHNSPKPIRIRTSKDGIKQTIMIKLNYLSIYLPISTAIKAPPPRNLL